MRHRWLYRSTLLLLMNLLQCGGTQIRPRSLWLCLGSTVSLQCKTDPDNANGALIDFGIVIGTDSVAGVYAYRAATGDTTSSTTREDACFLQTDNLADPATERVSMEIAVVFDNSPAPCGALKTLAAGVYTVTLLFRAHADASLVSPSDRIFTMSCRSDQLDTQVITSPGLPASAITPIHVLETQTGTHLRVLRASDGVPAGTFSLGEKVFLSFDFFPSLNAGPDYDGTEFVVGVLGNDETHDGTVDNIFVVVLPRFVDLDTYVTVTTPGNEPIEQTIEGKQGAVFQLDPSVMGCAEFGMVEVDSKGILISASLEVSVVVYNQNEGSQGWYSALPVDVLGTDYYTVSLPGSRVPTEAMIIAPEDDTTVTITLPQTSSLTLEHLEVTYGAGQSFSVTINSRGSVHFSLFSDNVEPSEAFHIIADKPVAVISGNRYVGLNNGLVSDTSGRLDHTVVQLPPTNRAYKDFVLLPSVPTLGLDSRVVTYIIEAVETGATTVTRKDTDQDIVLSGPGTFQTIDLASSDSPFVLTSDKSILVAQVLNSPENPSVADGFDPAMVLMPGRKQWAPEVDVYAHDASVTVGIVMSSSDIGTFTINSNPLPNLAQTALPVQGDNSIAFFMLPNLPGNTVYSFSSGSSISHMMVLAYSSPTVDSGAAFVAARTRIPEEDGCLFPGLQGDLLDNDCDGRIDEEDAGNYLDDDGDGLINEDTVKGGQEHSTPVKIRPISCKVSGVPDFDDANKVIAMTKADGCVASVSGGSFHQNGECSLVSGTALERKRTDCGEFEMSMFVDSPVVYFKCETQYCLANDDTKCTTEICQPSSRTKRQAERNGTTVITQVYVNTRPTGGTVTTIQEINTDPLRCLENTSFQVIAVLLIFLFLISFASAVYFWCLLRKQRKHKRRGRSRRSQNSLSG